MENWRAMRTSCAEAAGASAAARVAARIRLDRFMRFPRSCAWHAFLLSNCLSRRGRLGPCAEVGKALECRANQASRKRRDETPRLRDPGAGAAGRAPAGRAL